MGSFGPLALSPFRIPADLHIQLQYISSIHLLPSAPHYGVANAFKCNFFSATCRGMLFPGSGKKQDELN